MEVMVAAGLSWPVSDHPTGHDIAKEKAAAAIFGGPKIIRIVRHAIDGR
jgi:hypothetical protein